MIWQDQRTMTPYNFRTSLEALGLSQAACGRFLNLSSRQIARMLDGEATVPVPIALLFALMLAKGEMPIDPGGE
jgi:hypothetical protein